MIACFIMWLSYRLHYAFSHPYVCLSVHLTVLYMLLSSSKTKTSRKIKISIDVPQGTNKWSDNFQIKRSKVKVTRRQKPSQQSGIMFTYGWLNSVAGNFQASHNP